MSYRQFCSYGEDYFGDIYKAKLELLKKDKFINDVIRFNIVNTTYVDIEYVHQNYRDFFAASYLKNIITDDFSGVNINTVFGENFISPEVLILLGDILGEYKCINGGNSQIQEAVKIMGLKPMAVAQLVNIAAIARKNDLSSFDFGDLDLTSTALNKIKLYRDLNHKANFNNSKVTKSTFNARGHEGAVYAILYIKMRYLVSFSKNNIFCFDMFQHKHYQIAEYPEIAIHSAYYDEKSSSIFTGDMKGNCILWRYTIHNDKMSIKKVSENYFYYDSAECDQKNIYGESWLLKLESDICDMVEFDNRIYVGIFNGKIGSFNQKDDIIEDCQIEWEMSDKGTCRLSAGKKSIFASCGKSVCRLIRNKGKFDNEKWTCSTFTFNNNVQITDISVVNFFKEETLLISVNNTEKIQDENRDSSFWSRVFAVPVSQFDDIENFEAALNLVYSKPNSNTRVGFKGWRFFSNQFKNEIFLTANIEDNPESAGLLRISSKTDSIDLDKKKFNIVASDYYGNRHSMAVNCAVVFEYNGRKYIATGSTERAIELLSTEGGDATLLYHLEGHDNGIHSVDVVDEDKIITAHYSGEVCVWNRLSDKWRCVHSYNLHCGWVWQTRHIDYNGKTYIISCSYDNTISVVEECTEELICHITEPTGRVLTFGFLKYDLIIVGYINGEKNVLQKFQIEYDNKTYIAGACITKSDDKYFDELRCITPINGGLMLCFNNNSFGVVKTLLNSDNQELDVIQFSLSAIVKSDLNKKINLRCADEIAFDHYVVRAFGGDAHDLWHISSYLNISIYDSDNRLLYYKNNEDYGDGCSALKLLEYNSELYLILASYDCSINIFHVTLTNNLIEYKVIASRFFQSKVLDVQYKNHLLYISTLSGNVSICHLPDILRDDEAINYYIEHNHYKESERYYSNIELLFQSVSGFSYCHLDLTKVEAIDWDDIFKQEISYYAEVEE